MVLGWERIVRSDNPDHQLVVVNCAAYTAVDAAETDEDTAYAVNAAAPALLATACDKVGARLIHVSTDYVFPGDAATPYDVDDETGPRSAYGRTKLAGELAVRGSGAGAADDDGGVPAARPAAGVQRAVVAGVGGGRAACAAGLARRAGGGVPDRGRRLPGVTYRATSHDLQRPDVQ